nr:MAG TPA: hypothetical protein [Caudoviricetes sp.]
MFIGKNLIQTGFISELLKGAHNAFPNFNIWDSTTSFVVANGPLRASDQRCQLPLGHFCFQP